MCTQGCGRDFPGGPVVKNLPANSGDTGLSPGPGRFHMPWGSTLPSLYTPEPELCKKSCRELFPPQWEARAPQLESSPHSLQQEKACEQQQRPVQPKIHTILKIKKLKKIHVWCNLCTIRCTNLEDVFQWVSDQYYTTCVHHHNQIQNISIISITPKLPCAPIRSVPPAPHWEY